MREWTCSTCGVRVKYMVGFTEPSVLPDGWERDHGRLECLSCRHETVRAEAERGGASPKDQRRAVTAFEWIRRPRADPGDVARRTRISRAAAIEIRGRLRASGEIPKPPRGRGA